MYKPQFLGIQTNFSGRVNTQQQVNVPQSPRASQFNTQTAGRATPAYSETRMMGTQIPDKYECGKKGKKLIKELVTLWKADPRKNEGKIMEMLDYGIEKEQISGGDRALFLKLHAFS